MPELAAPAPDARAFTPLPPETHLAPLTRQLRAIPNLAAFLGGTMDYGPFSAHRAEAIAAWGLHGPAEHAARLARKRGVPFLAVADGYFQGLDYRGSHIQPCSLTVDRTGIYYDATRPSDLETLLNSSGWESPALLEEARTAMAAVVKLHLSKYNHAPDASPYLLTTPGLRTRVLILDQPVNDQRVRLSMADSESFIRMLNRAREEHPGAALFLKTHPAVLNKLRRGYLAHTPAARGVTLIPQDVSPMSLLAQADVVYTVSSQMGFEALLLDKEVHCFGMPFYAGWGLTTDSLACARRTATRTIEELFAAACILHTRYANPVTGEACSIHEIIRLLARQRQINEQNSRHTVCLGFTRQEYGAVRFFLSSTRAHTIWSTEPEEAALEAEINKGRMAVPFERVTRETEKLCARHGIPLTRVQPGFLPSLDGRLGLYPKPVSLVLDSRGLYDDPTRSSSLERILENETMPPTLLDRARAVMRFLVDEHILLNSEFSAGATGLAGLRQRVSRPTAAPEPELPSNRRSILIPGQDENSTATFLSCVDVGRGNECINSAPALLEAVRAERPDDFLIYLNIPGLKSPLTAADLPQADMVLNGTPPLDLLGRVAEVHTMSSLLGMDALLRRIPVFTYGGPFYAGWGLTTDKHTFSRRSRPLSLAHLVAGVLILYPAYYDWHTKLFCDPEEICRLHLLPPRPPQPLLVRLRRLWDDFSMLRK